MRYTVQNPGGPTYSAAALAVPLSPTACRAQWWGSSGVTGTPGSVPIRAPKPGVQNGGDHGQQVGQNSYGSPDYILPSILYVVPNQVMAPPVKIRSDNEIPVPAGALYNQPRLSMRGKRTGGRGQVAQPGTVVFWPSINVPAGGAGHYLFRLSRFGQGGGGSGG